MKSIRTRAFGNLMAPLALIAAAVVSQPAHALDAVSFIPGAYYLAESNLGPAVDTLVVTVSGGTADFTLSGVDNATFAVPNGRPSDGSPYYQYDFIDGSSVTASWDITAYPYLTFWTTYSEGGLNAGSMIGDQGTNYFDLFQSTQGTGQVFTVPEPDAWALMLIGFGVLGAGLRGTRKSPKVA